jgi:hypothetical protein
METMELDKTNAAPASALTSVIIRWEAADGVLKPITPQQKCVCALRMALKEHIDKLSAAKKQGSLRPEKNNQYFVNGKSIFVASCSATTVGDDSTYHAVGRAELGQVNMASDQLSSDMVSFDITWKDSKDELGLPDIQLVKGLIEALPRGSKLEQ